MNSFLFQFETGMRETGSGEDGDSTAIHHGKNYFLMQKKYHILIVAIFSVLRDVIWPERGNAQTGEENQGQVLVHTIQK